MIHLVAYVFSLLHWVAPAQASVSKTLYSPRGVGGGGALSGFSISPYSDLRFVGTDMGTLFRSVDGGKNWIAVAHDQAKFDSDLEKASEVGFSSDPKVTFYANAGRDPKRSRDAGVTWASIKVPLEEEERILYWVGDSKDAKLIFCATTDGLLRSTNQGDSWTRVKNIDGRARGTSLVQDGTNKRVFHATSDEIFLSDDDGKTFRSWHTPAGTGIRAFAAGADSKGLTLAYIDTKGEQACSWAKRAGDSSEEQKKATLDECGFVWVQNGFDSKFRQTRKEGGRFLRMADNDSQTLYVTGGNWVRQYGSKIWVSRDAGKSWNLKYQTYDWDQRPYKPWPRDKLEYSAVGLDVGWDDNVPFSFAINRRKSTEAGGTGHYFLHVTRDAGEHWNAPFTQYGDTGEPARGKRWKSTGLEVTSALRLKFHPKNSRLGYVSLADLGGYVTEDGGQTFRISKVKYNTNYDYAFDPARVDRVYAASGDRHDFPLNINTPLKGQGGIFVSDDRGRSWKRLTPDNSEFNRQFLSVAYDPIHRALYGGTQGGGIARSLDEGKTWKFFNSGFPEGERVIPQIEVDSKDGTAYALLTGDAPEYLNADETGIYRLKAGAAPSIARWELLRTTVERPESVAADVKLWQFPSAFAIDWSSPDRSVLWVTDIEQKGAWLASGVWKSLNGGKTWKRMTQYTHPTAIALVGAAARGVANAAKKSANSQPVVQVSGLYDVSGNWGKGGALFSLDGGKSWKKNDKFPLLANLFSFTPDPSDASKAFFLFFGGGLLHGPARP